MIAVREAGESDTTAIVGLLKLSLGERSALRTEEYWRWKHIRNPFGPSRVLLAFDGSRLVAVRAFMAWRFRMGDRLFPAWRAVDTAVHPQWQGKGLFTRLTTELIRLLEPEVPAFIFNSPNPRSMAGYLKMGWELWHSAPLAVRVSPLDLLANRFRPTASKSLALDLDSATPVFGSWREADMMTTDWSIDALRWRYEQIPGVRYFSHFESAGGGSCMLIARMVPRGSFRELRIVECFHEGEVEVVRRCIGELIKTTRPDATSIMLDGAGRLASLLPFGFLPMSRFAPVLIHRFLNDADALSRFTDVEKRYLSAGTLELF